MPRPYDVIAAELGVTAAEVRMRLAAMLERGIIRRIGAVPNHYAIGYTENGMSVWNVDDAAIDELGAQVGSLSFVTHCYHRHATCRIGRTTSLRCCTVETGRR